MFTIIYGRRGCGKTRNAARLRAKYPHKHFVDDWWVAPRKHSDKTLQTDADILLLTAMPLDQIQRITKGLRDVRVITFDEAMS